MIQLSTHEFSDSPFNKTRAAPGQALVSKPPFGPKTRGADRGLGPLWHPSPWHHLKAQALALSAFRSSLSSFNCHLSIVKNAQKSLKSPSFSTHHEHMAYSENRAYMGIPWYIVYPLNPSKSTGSSSSSPSIFAPKLAITKGPPAAPAAPGTTPTHRSPPSWRAAASAEAPHHPGVWWFDNGHWNSGFSHWKWWIFP